MLSVRAIVGVAALALGLVTGCAGDRDGERAARGAGSTDTDTLPRSEVVTDSSAPPSPFVHRGACPFECCVYGTWTPGDSIPLRQQPDEASPVVTVLPPGQPVTAVTGEVRSTPMAAVVVDSVELYGDGPEPFRLPASEVFYLLHYEGEGFYAAWHEGRIYSAAPACGMDPETSCRIANGGRLEDLDQVWWVLFRPSDGPEGWYRMREDVFFDGADACG